MKLEKSLEQLLEKSGLKENEMVTMMLSGFDIYTFSVG